MPKYTKTYNSDKAAAKIVYLSRAVDNLIKYAPDTSNADIKEDVKNSFNYSLHRLLELYFPKPQLSQQELAERQAELNQMKEYEDGNANH